MDTVWLSLNQLSDLFNRDKSVITRHLKNIYSEGELKEKSTVAKIATVQKEAGRDVLRNIEYFNLDAIISVGYRVNSKRGTEFRIWATKRLKDYLIKGYYINEKRLKETQKQFIELKEVEGSGLDQGVLTVTHPVQVTAAGTVAVEVWGMWM